MHRVTYFHETTVENVPDGQTLLEVSILGRIPHLHQCGGRARCTTCRVQILDGIANVSVPSPIEQEVAIKRGWDHFTRLACQTTVHGDVVIRRLLDNPQDIIVLDLDELGGVDVGDGKELELAVLFCDIRNFTSYSEKNLPYDVVHFLNQHFTAAAEAVLNNNGFIDKYIGDGIFAAFGIRKEGRTGACRSAVRAALGMQDAAHRLCPIFQHDFNISLRIGIGIHFGTAILGRIGHPGKCQITAIGDTVNTASRIEGMTKDLGVDILVSESVVARLPGELRLGQPIESKLKGRSERTLLYPCEGFSKPDMIHLVQSSFARLSARPKEFVELFYAFLFQDNPELRPLFKDDLTVQVKMLVSMLSSLVRGLNRIQEIEGGLQELGKRHLDYKVARADYDKVARALLRTLEVFLGDDFTPDVRQAWISVYRIVAGTMLEGADS